MIRHVCCHSRGLGLKDPVFAAVEGFVGPDQVIAGHADGEFGLQPTQIERATVGALRASRASHSRQSRLERSMYEVLIV